MSDKPLNIKMVDVPISHARFECQLCDRFAMLFRHGPNEIEMPDPCLCGASSSNWRVTQLLVTMPAGGLLEIPPDTPRPWYVQFPVLIERPNE